MRHLRGKRLEEIGRNFGVAKSSSVGNLVEGIKTLIKADRKLRHHVDKFKEEINTSQQQNPGVLISVLQEIKGPLPPDL